MQNPEQGSQQDINDTGALRQLLLDDPGLKLLNEAYDSKPSTSAKTAEEIKDLRKESKANMNTASGNLEKDGNVESLRLPSGFSKSQSDKTQNLVQFNSGSDKDTKVCYWKRDTFSADDEDSERITEVLKKPPHTLDEQETLDVMPMMMSGRPWGNGDHKDLSLSSADIDGRRVLVADFKFNNSDKRVHLIMANQDKDKHQIDNIWLEAPVKDFDKNNKAVVDAFKQIKWTTK